MAPFRHARESATRVFALMPGHDEEEDTPVSMPAKLPGLFDERAVVVAAPK
jgi:hypothetical protein